MIARRFMLFIASVYAIVIAVLLVSGPFMFELGPLRVQASTFRKPVQIVTLTLILAVALSPGVRAVARQSRVIGFYVLAAIVTWALALGADDHVHGESGYSGPVSPAHVAARRRQPARTGALLADDDDLPLGGRRPRRGGVHARSFAPRDGHRRHARRHRYVERRLDRSDSCRQSAAAGARRGRAGGGDGARGPSRHGVPRHPVRVQGRERRMGTGERL